LQAALNPGQTDYLYYVRDPARNDGAHSFYANESDFGRGVQALRDWERQRDAEMHYAELKHLPEHFLHLEFTEALLYSHE